MEIKVNEQLDEIIQQVVISGKKYKSGSPEQLIRDVYEQCQHYEYENSGAKEQLEKEIKKIEDANNLQELIPLLGKLYKEYGCNILFYPMVKNNPFKAENNALFAELYIAIWGQYLDDIYKDESTRIQVQNTVQNALYEFGIPFEEAKERGKQVTYMLFDIAGKSDRSLRYMEDVYAKTIFVKEEELENIFTDVKLSFLLECYGIEENPYGGWYTCDVGQLTYMGEIFKEENLENIKSYAITELFSCYQECLSDKLQIKKFEFVDQKAKECVKRYLEEQIGELYAENLGSLGMIVAHELSHGFDSQCILFDENGNYNPDWISKDDYHTFLERSGAVEEYYNTFTVMEVYPVDGKLTLGENYADLGAMEVLVTLIDKKEDYKKLFESYARLWCELCVDRTAVEMLELDNHSPASARVNAVLAVCEEFYETYGVKEGDGMYREEKRRED